MKPLNLTDLRAIWSGERGLALDAADYAAIDASAATVAQALATGAALYGVNTGFGKLASKRIDDAQLEQLQRNLVLSHAVGVGPALGRPRRASALWRSRSSPSRRPLRRAPRRRRRAAPSCSPPTRCR